MGIKLGAQKKKQELLQKDGIEYDDLENIVIVTTKDSIKEKMYDLLRTALFTILILSICAIIIIILPPYLQ